VTYKAYTAGFGRSEGASGTSVLRQPHCFLGCSCNNFKMGPCHIVLSILKIPDRTRNTKRQWSWTLVSHEPTPLFVSLLLESHLACVKVRSQPVEPGTPFAELIPMKPDDPIMEYLISSVELLIPTVVRAGVSGLVSCNVDIEVC
jgi:hypothetical protein